MRPVHLAPIVAVGFAGLVGCSDPPSTSSSGTTTATTSAPKPTPISSTSAPAPTSSAPREPGTERWSFDADETGKPPAGFEVFVGPGSPKTWTVENIQFSPSMPRIVGISQADDRDARPAALVLTAPRKDVRVSVRCLIEARRSNKVESLPNPFGACGVIARWKDAENYYLAAAHANAHEGEVVLYAVKNGQRAKIGGVKVGEIPWEWVELVLTVKGDAVGVSFARPEKGKVDPKPVYETHDKTFPEAGGVGLWTFVNSLTSFDDFAVTNL